MTTVCTEYDLEVDGKEQECLVFGTCRRDLTGHIECEVERVMYQGRNILGDVPEQHMAYMRQRLWHAAIMERHPGGHGEDAAV